MRFPTGLRALHHRDFRLFFSGQLISLIGTWMQSVAQAWLVLELTNSPFKLGLISALQSAPMLCLAFVAGAIADRLPKRRILIGTQTALMGQAFVLAVLVWSGVVQYWHVALLATCYGLAFTLDMPTRQSFVVEMASKEDLPNAIALNSSMVSGARMVGPAVAGLLVDRYGTAPAFGLNGLSFVAVILALAAMRADGLPGPAQGTTVREEIAAGLRYAVRTPLVALPLGLLLTLGLFVMNHNVLVPLLARDVLHEGAHGFGLLMAAVGTGAIVGALAMATLLKGHPPLTLLLGTGWHRCGPYAGARGDPPLLGRHARPEPGGAGADGVRGGLQHHAPTGGPGPDARPDHEPLRLRVCRFHAPRVALRGHGRTLARGRGGIRTGGWAGTGLDPGPGLAGKAGVGRFS